MPAADDKLTPARRRTLLGVSERIGYEFKDLALLDRALTHASLGNEGHPSYERLEFLGDAILGFVVADSLYAQVPEIPEGELTDRRAQLVSRRPLSKLARDLDLPGALAVGRGLRSADLESRRIQADLIEGVLGAIYRDGGIRAARKFVRTHILTNTATENAQNRERDPKSRLLHLAQCHGLGQPQYSVIKMRGPDHEREFTIAVAIAERQYGTGSARSKQSAEMAAAEEAWHALRDELENEEDAEAGD